MGELLVMRFNVNIIDGLRLVEIYIFCVLELPLRGLNIQDQYYVESQRRCFEFSSCNVLRTEKWDRGGAATIILWKIG